jgi:hypothetical protein
MERKFKHKATGKVAELNALNYLVKDECYIPKWVVENSKDWLEITEPEVPEYVKCNSVNSESHSYAYKYKAFTIGKIYKVKEGMFVCNDNGEETTFGKESLNGKGENNMTLFSASTKSEYEAQQREEIMQECIKRFPKGSVVKCADDGRLAKVNTLKSSGRNLVDDAYYYGVDSPNILAVNESDDTGFYLYYEGKFAELVSLPTQVLDYELLSFTPSLDAEVRINRVKRKSDGEIFAINDVVELAPNGYIKHTIVAFKSEGGKLKVMYDIIPPNGTWNWLEDIKHSKTPIFRTEDGVDVFEGDKYWFVDASFEIIKATCIVGGCKHPFSTEEAAKKYVLNNKLCLSLEEANSLNYNTLYQLAKQRTA